ncbi:MAG: hypothetical protein WCO50_00115, partial [Synechococcus sp. ELA619]
ISYRRIGWLAVVVEVAFRCPLAWFDDLKARQLTIAHRAISDHLAAELDPKPKRSGFDRPGKVTSDPAFGVLVVVVGEIASGDLVGHKCPDGLDSLLGHLLALCVVHLSSSPKSVSKPELIPAGGLGVTRKPDFA